MYRAEWPLIWQAHSQLIISDNQLSCFILQFLEMRGFLLSWAVAVLRYSVQDRQKNGGPALPYPVAVKVIIYRLKLKKHEKILVL